MEREQQSVADEAKAEPEGLQAQGNDDSFTFVSISDTEDAEHEVHTSTRRE